MALLTRDIVHRLKVVIEKSGLRKTEFAQRLGISPSAIHEILSMRQTSLSELFLKAIHREFQISTNWLLHGEGGMEDTRIISTSRADEVDLIIAFRKLDEEQRQILSGFVKYLSELPRNTRTAKPKKKLDTIADF